MQQQNDSPALTSEEQVRELASLFIRMSEAIHHALRELAGSKSQNAASAYALLTEEYALRSRANMLMIEASRFARPGLNTTQHEMLDIVEKIHSKLKSACTLEELSEIIIGVILFANSIASRKNHIVTFLLNDLKSSVDKFDALAEK
jgi:hypothetical protein